MTHPYAEANITAAMANLRTEIIRHVADLTSREIALASLARVQQVAVEAVRAAAPPPSQFSSALHRFLADLRRDGGPFG